VARRSIDAASLGRIRSNLKKANAVVARRYPGESGDRQAVHTVYGGAHLFRSDTAERLGKIARESLKENAPDPAAFAGILGIDDDLATPVYSRVVEKLKREPVEDFRIDFEDGYGNRPDAEEDGHAESAAGEVAKGLSAGTLPPFIGIRIKPMSEELSPRSLRTLDVFVTTLIRATGRRLPPNFVITVPKLMSPAHVTAVARACTALERRLKLPPQALRLELMIETPQSILASDGSSALPALVQAGGGRVTGAHFGTYDYTALAGITAAWQHMRHPVCDFAKHMMQVALAQSGIVLSDGATNVMPVAPNKAAPGAALTVDQARENRDSVHRAWKRHFDDVTHSLVNGYYQGWDLHPAQLPTRYAAVFAFFLGSRAAATTRLKNFVERAAQATLVGDVFDDAATGQGLLNYFLRGLNSGALTPDEARETGLTLDEIQMRSFLKIVKGRSLAT
jgi:citrate lyase beta subunit